MGKETYNCTFKSSVSHRIYYHVAAMGHWREIVAEQLRLIAATKMGETVHIGFSGNQYEAEYIHRTADTYGVHYTLLFWGSGNDQYEFPTLQSLYEACVQEECERVVYIHTKGASHNGDWTGIMWRWFLNAYILRARAIALGALEECDWCAPVVSTGLGDGLYHAVGNFWAANASHIRNLASPNELRQRFPGIKHMLKLPSWVHERHGAEMWIGTETGTAIQLYVEEDCDIAQYAWWCRRHDMQVFATKYGS